MESETPRIEHRSFEETRIAGFRRVLDGRDGIREALRELRRRVPAEHIDGPPFCIIQFVTSVKDGHDAEVGVPVSRVVEDAVVVTSSLPAMEVLSIVHCGSPDTVGESYSALYGHASKLGIISDEFCREVYPDWGAAGHIEIQFVIHSWNALLGKHAARVLGEDVSAGVMAGAGEIGIDATVDERFRWVKAAVERIDAVSTESQRYDILSSCAHVFPEAQARKLRDVYVAA